MTRIHPRLPVFRVRAERDDVLYVPGRAAVVSKAQADAVAALFARATELESGPAEPVHELARELAAAAEAASGAWQARQGAAFAPECLTVYLSNRCNLGCTYCYSATPAGARLPEGALDLPVLDVACVAAAARIVAPICRARGKAFTLVVHGGGEPTLHWSTLQQVVATTRAVAAAHDVPWWGYIATNGVLAPERAAWLGRTFDRIGLSCDGPADVHDAQRPAADGSATADAVARSARVWSEAGTPFVLRATVTPASVHRQADMVLHAHRLGAEELAIEPAYGAGRGTGRAFAPHDADAFVRAFDVAQSLGEELGTRVSISGVRLDEIHGPHCNVLRDVLHLTPDGAATACFLCTDSRRPADAALAIGQFGSGADGPFDHQRIAAIRARAMRIPARCHECVNVYHCARDCPDVCPVTDTGDLGFDQAGFRCRVQQRLGTAWIRRLVEADPPARSPATRDHPAQRDAQAVADFARQAPAAVAVAEIVRAWQRLRLVASEVRTMPRPPWADRGFDEDGAQAWQRLATGFPGGVGSAAMSVYVHVPFCDRKCAFCDCYTMRLPAPARTPFAAAYTAALVADAEAFSRCGDLRRRPVTTVHFGGGTPTYLEPEQLARVVAALRACLAIDAHTEWALESTSSQLDRRVLESLRALGFRRLHVGVQTLHDPLREVLGRREPAAVVLEKIALAAALGFIVSVDLIYGLPGQTACGLAADIDRVHALPIAGVSLYQLNSTARNRAFAMRHQSTARSAAGDYLLFAMGEQLLRARGYRKNHFAHFARGADDNLYYTHAARGEDLLALGTTADGIFGDYRYRHCEYRDYMLGRPCAPPLQGGGFDTPAESRARAASAALMAGSISRVALAAAAPAAVVEQWRESGLLRPDGEGFALTASGSWCLSAMLAQIVAVPA